MGTGWFAAVAAGVQPGMTVAVGADAALECVGTDEAMHQAIRSTRAGGGVGVVGVPHGVTLTGRDLFGTMVRVHGGPAPVRRFLPTSSTWCTPAPSTPGG
jgi:threonine dehydrogenase-like Zn-dependent dehydrogenase